MKRIDVEFNGQEYTFRTNDSGFALFIGVRENKQISTEDGFDSLRKIKRYIRSYLTAYEWDDFDCPAPRCKYTVCSAFRD